MEVVDGREKVFYERDEFNDKKSAEAFRAAGFERVPEKGDGKVFTDIDEMLMAYQDEIVDIHAKVKVRMYLDENDKRGNW